MFADELIWQGSSCNKSNKFQFSRLCVYLEGKYFLRFNMAYVAFDKCHFRYILGLMKISTKTSNDLKDTRKSLVILYFSTTYDITHMQDWVTWYLYIIIWCLFTCVWFKKPCKNNLQAYFESPNNLNNNSNIFVLYS